MSFRKVVFDTAAMSSVSVMRLLAQLAVVPILARFLSPTDYGLVGLAMPFILFAMILADAGVGMSLVRTPANDRRAWSTCFWLSVMLGLVLAAIIIGLAPLASALFDQPRLGPMVMALAFVILAQALATVPGALLQQRRQFRVIAKVEIVALTTGIGIALAVALRGGGAWALIWQQVTFFGARLILTWLYSPFKPLFILDVQAVKEHLTFGGHLLCANIATWFSRSLDNVVIGKVLGAAPVGVYSMTYQFVRLPLVIVTGPLQAVIYTHLIQFKDDKAALRQMYLYLTRILAIVLFPAIGMVAAASDAVFRLLLSDKWSQSGMLFALLAPACALQAVTALGATVRMALGRTDAHMRATVEFGVIWITTLLTFVSHGLDSVCIAYNCAVLLYCPRSLALVLPLIECPARKYAYAIFTPAVVTIACIAVFRLVTHIALLTYWAQLAMAGACAALGISVSALMQLAVLRTESRLWRHSAVVQA